MNTESAKQLKISAETGDIKLLYEVIQVDPSILENIDKNQFIETPLHISASRGYLEFATEIMNLKPSFAMKLNKQGYSPIHLAMQHGQTEMVSKLVDMNKDLVRVKGREGFTPLHFACKNEKIELLAEFLIACPDSIEDVNVRGQSALHIAIINDQFDALQVLVGWLKGNCTKGARVLQNKIFNHKDNAGNTLLHTSALESEPEVLQFLLKLGIRLNGKNKDGKTALDLARTLDIEKARTRDIENILIRADAKPGSKIPKTPTLAEKLRFMATIIDFGNWLYRIRSNITEEQRNTWLIIATLIATVTYESALSPPGGVFQVSASDDNNMKITHHRDEFFSTRGNAGKSILSKDYFMIFSLANVLSFSVSIIAILIMTPWGALNSLVITPVLLFYICYLVAMPAISPTRANTYILYIPMLSIEIIIGVYVICILYSQVIKLRYIRSNTQPAVARV